MTKKTSVRTRTPENYEAMIAVAAYFKAERRGFLPGREVDDWLDAKNELDDLLLGRADASRRTRRSAPSAPRGAKTTATKDAKSSAKAAASAPRKKSAGTKTAAASKPAKKGTGARGRTAKPKLAERKA
jgi:hypothetical protein